MAAACGGHGELLTSAEARARALLTEHEETLTRLTAALLEHETITGDQVRALVSRPAIHE